MGEWLTEYGAMIAQGTWETVYMTAFSTLFAYVLGLPLGVLLTTTKQGGISPAPRFNVVFGGLVNTLRSLPFLILMILVFPLTRLIIGTAIGSKAAIVPLVISAAPFVARMVETSLEEVDRGVVEAARCMGSTNFQIITRVLLVESIPSLMRGLSISLITILGYTAVTGAIGARGLGYIAYNMGYQRYQASVMYATVVILIIFVFLVQATCNLLARKLDKRNR